MLSHTCSGHKWPLPSYYDARVLLVTWHFCLTQPTYIVNHTWSVYRARQEKLKNFINFYWTYWKYFGIICDFLNKFQTKAWISAVPKWYNVNLFATSIWGWSKSTLFPKKWVFNTRRICNRSHYKLYYLTFVLSNTQIIFPQYANTLLSFILVTMINAASSWLHKLIRNFTSMVAERPLFSQCGPDNNRPDIMEVEKIHQLLLKGLMDKMWFYQQNGDHLSPGPKSTKWPRQDIHYYCSEVKMSMLATLKTQTLTGNTAYRQTCNSGTGYLLQYRHSLKKHINNSDRICQSDIGYKICMILIQHVPVTVLISFV